VERLAALRPRLRNLDALIARDGWKLVCLLRVSPIMPFSATSLALGLSPIGLRDYNYPPSPVKAGWVVMFLICSG
jgi:uncharacterized membrane protein YdjX (TVP38/TMEM64 family)